MCEDNKWDEQKNKKNKKYCNSRHIFFHFTHNTPRMSKIYLLEHANALFHPPGHFSTAVCLCVYGRPVSPVLVLQLYRTYLVPDTIGTWCTSYHMFRNFRIPHFSPRETVRCDGAAVACCVQKRSSDIPGSTLSGETKRLARHSPLQRSLFRYLGGTIPTTTMRSRCGMGTPDRTPGGCGTVCIHNSAQPRYFPLLFNPFRTAVPFWGQTT